VRVSEPFGKPVKRRPLIRYVTIASFLAALIALPVLAKPPVLILPHPSLLRAQLLLRQAEQDGAIARQPGAVLVLQEKINAAWLAYHLQVEEEADKPDDEEAVLARHLAEEVELDAELLQVMLHTQAHEARLDGLRPKPGMTRPERLVIPPAPAAVGQR
jgi:hypothetical protein